MSNTLTPKGNGVNCVGLHVSINSISAQKHGVNTRIKKGWNWKPNPS